MEQYEVLEGQMSMDVDALFGKKPLKIHNTVRLIDWSKHHRRKK